MARPKKEDELEEGEDKPKKKKKSDIYLSADYILDRPDVYVPSFPALDVALGGGFPEGTIAILVSQPKLGKTTLGMQILANAQAMGKVAGIVNVESRLKKINLNGVKGLDLSPDKLKLITSQEGDILSAETALSRAEQFLHDFPGGVLLIDSFSSLVSGADLTNEYTDQTMGGSSRLQAKFVKRNASVIDVNRSIVIGVVHFAPNFSPYGGPTENVTQKMQYGHDIKLKGGKDQPFEWLNEKGDLIGQRVKWEVLTSALATRGETCTGWLKFGHGYSNEMSIIEVASDLGVLEKGGAGWYTMPSGEKVQGTENVFKLLMEQPELYKEIENKVKGILV